MPRPPKPPTTLLGQVLRELRGERSVSSIAAELGCAHSTLTRLEQGQGSMSAQLALAIARWIGWSVEQVIEAAGKPPREAAQRTWTLRRGPDGWPGEDEVYAQTLGPALAELPEPARKILEYVSLEMLNNAFDHAQAASVLIDLDLRASFAQVTIGDNGVGIFQKLAAALGLDDESLVPLELAKGKLTTDPARHAGEGIFFSSRMVDVFALGSGRTRYVRKNGAEDADDELSLFRPAPGAGTVVGFSIALDTQRTPKQVFDAWSDPETYTFSRTQAIVSLVGVGQEQLVSRSQARRLLARLDLFKEVELDFENVDFIGQAFADEIFRVWQTEHPTIKLIPTNTTEDVRRMIAHVGGPV